MKMRYLKNFVALSAAVLMLAGCAERTYHIELFSTNDLHGTLLSRGYTSADYRPSLSSAYGYLDSIRGVFGEENVMLVDCGDVLQGDNATYYYNFVDDSTEHIAARVFNFMEYDVAVPGNHDFEAGHEVYDRLEEQLDMPYIAANAYHEEDGSPYFEPYAIVKKGGLKIAVIGITNANVKSFISPEKYSGIDFCPAEDVAFDYVEEVKRKYCPDLTVLAVHCGLGEKDVQSLENNAMYLAANVPGVDVVLAGHDHRYMATIVQGVDGEVAVCEAGSKAKAIARVSVDVTKKGGKVLAKKIVPMSVDLRRAEPSEEFDAEFEADYRIVNEYSNRIIGELAHDLDLTFDNYKRSKFLAWIHNVQLSVPGVDISITAPLVTEGTIPAGPIKFNDLFTLYRFENLLYVLKMSGAEVHRFLEAAYDGRISGKGPMYNFDSAGGLVYTVDSTLPLGERIKIVSMADGTPFDPEKVYNVAMTSYRASGAGRLLKAAGVDPSEVQDRLVAIHPEIRMMLHDYILEHGKIDVNEIAGRKINGTWHFVR